MKPMHDEGVALEELAQLKELAKEGMAKEFRGDMGLADEAQAEGGDIEPVPGAEDAEVTPAGGEGGELDPALLAKVLAAMSGG